MRRISGTQRGCGRSDEGLRVRQLPGGLVIGGLVGAAVGLLLAPEAGERLREQVGEFVDEPPRGVRRGDQRGACGRRDGARRDARRHEARPRRPAARRRAPPPDPVVPTLTSRADGSRSPPALGGSGFRHRTIAAVSAQPIFASDSSASSRRGGIRACPLHRCSPATTRRLLFVNSGMVQFKRRAHRRGEARLRAGRGRAAVPAGRRQAQRLRGGRPHAAPPHPLRDARQLELRRLLQARGDPLGAGSS